MFFLIPVLLHRFVALFLFTRQVCFLFRAPVFSLYVFLDSGFVAQKLIHKICAEKGIKVSDVSSWVLVFTIAEASLERIFEKISTL
ncbi:hypothetical protein LXL04_016055 [Taraxacum kok-saghyz]